jgi:hypothetical protein
MLNRNKESGAVSLFVVIFAMLLITIVTISFVRLMIRDQEQATVNDLSQSAYDSALAGAEDAKRALIWYRTVCVDGGDCGAAHDVISSDTCNAGLQEVITVPNGNGEVPVQQQQSSNDAQLNQAYTCVKMELETEDYLGSLTGNASKVIPLDTTAPFTRVTVQWFTSEDMANSSAVDLIPKAQADAVAPLYLQTNWPLNRPSLLRVQLMQFADDFTLSSFDETVGSNSNANTLFLYPSAVGLGDDETDVVDTVFFSDDERQEGLGEPQPVQCVSSVIGGGYACTVELVLPNPIGGDQNSRTAFLRLSALYNGAHFRVTPTGARFDGVQPSIDSTGRANDVYRRVETRVDLVDTNFPFPEAAVDVTGNFCKDFLVTDRSSDFANQCAP